MTGPAPALGAGDPAERGTRITEALRRRLPAQAEAVRLAPGGKHGAYRLGGALHVFEAANGRDLFEPWRDATGITWSKVPGRVAVVERFRARNKPRLDVVEPGLLRVVQLELPGSSARSISEFGRDHFLVRTSDSLELCERDGSWVRTVAPPSPSDD